MPPVVTITNHFAEIGLLQYLASTSKLWGRDESFACAYMNVICLCAYFRSSQMSRCIFVTGL